MIKRLVPALTVIGGTILAMVLGADAAWAQKRVALVLGNSTYQAVPQLPNPARDADSIARMFRDAGFEKVDVALNLGNLDFKRAIRKFESEADQADIAVVYYAGHGLEISGTNYLIPTDARLASDRDAEDEAIPLERLVSSADGAKKLRVIILDACRDNPFTVKMRRERKTASRAVTSGLGKVEPTSTDTLIAYAAKAGSTAEDGDGQHSPFTTAVLKNLTIPGLDIRLAFGRVRDEVLKSTGSRQEPFVYGSLGGGNVSLVPAPVETKEVPASASDIKADYDLVAKIGSKRAWEVFLGTYKTGFYADLARAQLASLNEKQTAPTAPSGSVAVPDVDGKVIAPVSEPSAREAADWDKVKDSDNPTALERFIKRHANSPLAITAQQRLDVLKQAAREREEKARAEREAARKAAEEARIEAERKKAELAAIKKREDEERRARAAEAAAKARAEEAERLAAKKREDDERRAKAAEAEQKAKALEADRKAAEAKRKAEEAEKAREAARAAELRAESERVAKAAEEARKKAEVAAAMEATCKNEQTRLDAISAKGSDGSGIDDLKTFAKSITCERIKPQAVAALDKFTVEAAKRAAAQPNSPELVRAAQTQLARLGCMTGKPDGALNVATKDALGRYLTIKGQPVDDAKITEAVVSDLTKQSARVCPLECKANETAKGEVCVANAQPSEPAAVHAKPVERETPRKPARRDAEREKPRYANKPAPAAPQARQQATSRPGGAQMIGVGF